MDERLRFVARLLEGEKMAVLCREFDISRKTGYKLFARYKDCGVEGLSDRSRRPYRHANRLPFQIETLIVQLKKEHPSWGAPKIREKIVAAHVITPLDLEEKYGLSGGHIHHGEQTLDQFFTFRPLIGFAQYRTPLKRLYLCGAGTHPGGGLTGLPGANAAREITRDFKEKKV